MSPRKVVQGHSCSPPFPSTPPLFSFAPCTETLKTFQSYSMQYKLSCDRVYNRFGYTCFQERSFRAIVAPHHFPQHPHSSRSQPIQKASIRSNPATTDYSVRGHLARTRGSVEVSGKNLNDRSPRRILRLSLHWRGERSGK